jgi:hypothetical protein
MADNTSNYGFRWQKQLGAGSTLQPIRCFAATGYQAAPSATNVDLNVGDPVKRVSDGSVALCAAGDATYGIIVGIGPFYDSVQGVMRFGKALPGGTAWGTIMDRQSVLWVVPIAGQIFEVDADDNTTATTQAAYQAFFGENADITINQAAGPPALANPRLDISTHATTNTLVWRILELSTRQNQDFTGNYVKLLVTGNVVQQAPFQTTGV